MQLRDDLHNFFQLASLDRETQFMQKVYLVWMTSRLIHLACVKTNFADLICELEIAEGESRAPKLKLGRRKILKKMQLLRFCESESLNYMGCWSRYRVYAQLGSIWPPTQQSR